MIQLQQQIEIGARYIGSSIGILGVVLQTRSPNILVNVLIDNEINTLVKPEI